jgi:undecaprenyl-diphosphatase
MDAILSFDQFLFRVLNGADYPGWLDHVMRVLTDVRYARPLLAITALCLIGFGRRRGLVIVLGAVVTLTLSDQLSSHVIKPWVGRIRPSNALEEVNLLVPRTHSYSFPSSHAANTFAGALYFSAFAPGAAVPLFALATVVSFTRVYVGVHYPLDLAAGAALGLSLASLVLAIMSRLGLAPRRWWLLTRGRDRESGDRDRSPDPPAREARERSP